MRAHRSVLLTLFGLSALTLGCGNSEGGNVDPCQRDPSKCGPDAGSEPDPCDVDPAKCTMTTMDAAAPVYDETPPLFTVTPVDLEGTYDPDTHRLGALWCIDSDPFYGWCFDAFGIEPMLSSHAPIKNPTLNYRVEIDAPVRAVVAGTVMAMEPKTEPWDGPNAWGVAVQTSADSAFIVEYDHLKDPTVEVGSTMEAGDVIGVAGQYIENDSSMIELGLHYHKTATDGTATNRCPALYGSDEFNARNEAALAAAQDAFPDGTRTGTKLCEVDQDP